MASQQGSFVRWQRIAIAQMGYTNNVMLTLATASLGFGLTLAKNSELRSHCVGRLLMLAGGFLLVMSIGVGLWCAWSRLEDFRETAQIAKQREEFEGNKFGTAWINDQLRRQRTKNKKREKLSKCLLKTQIISFGAGVAFLAVVFLVVYGNNLF